jgi:transposase-like protein
MTPKQSISAVDELGKLLYEADGDLLRASLEKRYNLLMELEVESKTGAAKNQRSEGRINYRNGTRSRHLDTSAGRIQLDIPKLRHGSYIRIFTWMPPFPRFVKKVKCSPWGW